MKYCIPAVGLAVLLLSGCARTAPLYENDDLVSIVHNEVTDYTLLVYRNEDGWTRQVLRRKGVCEMMLIETHEGVYYLKERGEEVRKLKPTMVAAVLSSLHELVYDEIADRARGNHGRSLRSL